jgi:FkbM family methyltransferase
MSHNAFRNRLNKLAVAVTNPVCWRALRAGVAPAIEHLGLLKSLNIDGIIDVGANRGQFTLACRLAKSGVSVVAFEPIPFEAATFRRIHGQCADVRLVESALGETAGTATLHLSHSADSSSLLPIGERQSALFRGTSEVGTLNVPVQRLDDLGAYWSGRHQQLLKLDVQGFELNVLKGGVDTLRSCAFVYAECSEVPLYDGQALRPEVSAFLSVHGFREADAFNRQYDGTQLIQADYLYTRG